jgi:glycosyltransferase involved in cell wall biosynthesis
VNVTQVLCAAGPVDAVTNQAFACRALFGAWGWGGEDFAARLDPAMRRRHVRPLAELELGSEDLLLLHYSGYAPELERLFTGETPTLLLSHNITPAEWFWPYEPVEGVRCQLGRIQLAELAHASSALAGVSQYNADELRELTGRDAEVLPIVFDRSRLAPPAGPPAGPPTILFVGRLAPHKRQELLIRVLGRYRRHEPEARLVLVGTPLSPSYGEQLHRLAEETAPGAVSFEAGISAAELAERYREAHVFLCLSEHEGFCIPLLEAFHYGVPVIARDAAAIGEVLGDAGVLLAGDDDLATVAELLSIVVGDEELRTQLRARGERRLAAFDHGAVSERLREAVLRAAAR